MANALAYFGDSRTKETEHFVRQFDRFFDCLNVRSLSESIHKNKDDRKPYTSVEDARLKVNIVLLSLLRITSALRFCVMCFLLQILI